MSSPTAPHTSPTAAKPAPDISFSPRTGQRLGEVAATPAAEVTATIALAAAAASAVGTVSPQVRAGWMRAVADRWDTPEVAAELIAVADEETALGVPRLSGELARMGNQFRFYATVAEEGSWLGATIDTHGTSPLARIQLPRGPVAVFGASNFPFAFGALGNDTASALAAGCPVIAKAHPAHPQLSALLRTITRDAFAEAGAPAGIFDMVAGFDAGVSLVEAADITAVGFTGSQRGGMALWRAAQERPIPIPVFAEMGTVNPVILTRAALSRAPEIARGAVDSFTLGTGQFCTKPGLLFAPECSGFAAELASALAERSPQGWHLTEAIADTAADTVQHLQDAGAHVVAQGTACESGWSSPATVLTAPAAALVPGSPLLAECFGPVLIVVEYAEHGHHTLPALVSALQGTLVGTIMSGGAGDPEVAELVQMILPVVGRVTCDEWPTFVDWTWAQQHGGPWPATTSDSFTSVGAAALDRFTRPVAFQGIPDHALPAGVQQENPWRIPRRVNGSLHHPEDTR